MLSKVERSGIPHLAKNERDVGHPALIANPKVRRRTYLAISVVQILPPLVIRVADHAHDVAAGVQ